MTRHHRLAALLGGLCCLVLSAAGAAGDPVDTLHVGDAWARAPVGAGRTSAAFLTLYNIGDAGRRLVAAASPAAERVELHRSAMQDGVMRMRPVEAIAVPAAGHAKLRPGGLHLMLVGTAVLQPGGTVELTLRFADGAARTLQMPVLQAGTTPAAVRDQALVQMRRVTADGPGARVGTLALRRHPDGLLAVPLLQGLQPGPHAMHVHANGDCGPAERDGRTLPGGAAGGHYDPAGTGRYTGPYGDGAAGDMPNLLVEANGTATIPVLAPRLSLDAVRGRSVMLHQGADRYGPRLPGADALAGGGGEQDRHGGMRMVCGVVPE